LTAFRFFRHAAFANEILRRLSRAAIAGGTVFLPIGVPEITKIAQTDTSEINLRIG
jgi:hypothetical protein